MNKYISLVAQVSCLCIIGATLSIVTLSSSLAEVRPLAGNGCKVTISSQLPSNQWDTQISENVGYAEKEGKATGKASFQLGFSASCEKGPYTDPGCPYPYCVSLTEFSESECTGWCIEAGAGSGSVFHFPWFVVNPAWSVSCEGHSWAHQQDGYSTDGWACNCGPASIAELHDTQLFPLRLVLENITPNPCYRGQVSIAFILPEKVNVSLRLYDSSGRLLATLVNEEMTKGKHTIKWSGVLSNGQYLLQGIYFLRLEAGKDLAVKKLVVLK